MMLGACEVLHAAATSPNEMPPTTKLAQLHMDTSRNNDRSCVSTLSCMDMSTKSACLQHNAAVGQEISQGQQPVGFCWCIDQDWVGWMRHKLAQATCLMLPGCERNLSRRTSSSIWVAASLANTHLSQVISKCGCGNKSLPVCESLSAAHSCCRRLTADNCCTAAQCKRSRCTWRFC